MIQCPNCLHEGNQVHAGKNRSGSQRVLCKWCGKRYTPEPKPNGYPAETRKQAVLMCLEGHSFRLIGETLALGPINAVGPGGHFLAQKHTRKYMRTAMKRGIAHHPGTDGKYRDPHEYAVERAKWILENHQPEPLEDEKQRELTRILAAADAELN